MYFPVVGADWYSVQPVDDHVFHLSSARQAEVTKAKAVALDNSTTSSHQRALDLLAYINNTMASIEGEPGGENTQAEHRLNTHRLNTHRLNTHRLNTG